MAHRETVKTNLTSLSGLIKLIIFISLILLFFYYIPKSCNRIYAENKSHTKISGGCNEYYVSSFFGWRWHNRAILNGAINGCVIVELLPDTPFTLEFGANGSSISFNCEPLENGVSVIAFKCPEMQRPFILDPNKHDYKLESTCGQSPLKIYGAGTCKFNFNY